MSDTEVSELAEALRAFLVLVDDQDLVRNTAGDGDVMTFLRQGTKITSALQKAHVALALADRQRNHPASLTPAA